MLAIMRKHKDPSKVWDRRLFVLTDRHLAYYSKTDFMPEKFSVKEGKMAGGLQQVMSMIILWRFELELI